MSKVKIRLIIEEDDCLVGEFEPSEIQSVIDLFLAHDYINPDGDNQRVKHVYLMVHDFTAFQVELA